MKKISVFITAILMLAFIIIPTNSVQAMGMNEIIKNVEQTNKQINSEIEKAVYAAQIITDDYNDDLIVLVNSKDNIANRNQKKIQKLEDRHNAKIDEIINNLLQVTNKMASETINDAAKEGVTVYCEWVEVTLGGRIVLVDPLRIANE